MCRLFARRADMYIIVGLGNPGDKYERTNHNMGFGALDELASRHGITIEKKKCKALVGEGSIGGERCVLCKPQTFMNLSGESVVQLLSWYKCEKDQLIVIYDDVDLPAGKVRFRAEGSAGTHNGMRNIVALTGRTDFPRFRIGIGRPPEYMDLADFVLSRPTGENEEAIKAAFKKTADAVEIYIKDGLEKTQVFVGK